MSSTGGRDVSRTGAQGATGGSVAVGSSQAGSGSKADAALRGKRRRGLAGAGQRVDRIDRVGGRDGNLAVPPAVDSDSSAIGVDSAEALAATRAMPQIGEGIMEAVGEGIARAVGDQAVVDPTAPDAAVEPRALPLDLHATARCPPQLEEQLPAGAAAHFGPVA